MGYKIFDRSKYLRYGGSGRGTPQVLPNAYCRHLERVFNTKKLTRTTVDVQASVVIDKMIIDKNFDKISNSINRYR